jgi:hypothetical protein
MPAWQVGSTAYIPQKDKIQAGSTSQTLIQRFLWNISQKLKIVRVTGKISQVLEETVAFKNRISLNQHHQQKYIWGSRDIFKPQGKYNKLLVTAQQIFIEVQSKMWMVQKKHCIID